MTDYVNITVSLEGLFIPVQSDGEPDFLPVVCDIDFIPQVPNYGFILKPANYKSGAIPNKLSYLNVGSNDNPWPFVATMHNLAYFKPDVGPNNYSVVITTKGYMLPNGDIVSTPYVSRTYATLRCTKSSTTFNLLDFMN